MFKRITPIKFFGIGPKKSLDKRIDFIFENRNIARRISQITAREGSRNKSSN